jgi:hypothetical protein
MEFTPMLTIITALITAIVGPILLEIIKNKIKNASKDIVGESINMNEKIDNQLGLLIKELECDRICIAQFHNGGHFYPTNKSIKKFSIFYEKVTTKANSIRETLQNIPVSLFPKTFSILYKDEELIIPNFHDTLIDCDLLHINGEEYNIKSAYIFSIKDINDNFIGLLLISYHEKEHALSLDEWIILRQKIGVIGTILTDYLHR